MFQSSMLSSGFDDRVGDLKRLNFIIPILAAVSALCAVGSTGPVALGEVNGQKGESPAETPSGVSSRPKREVDFELFRGLRVKGW